MPEGADGFGDIGRAPVGEAQRGPLAYQAVERQNVTRRLARGFHGPLEAIVGRVAPLGDIAQDCPRSFSR